MQSCTNARSWTSSFSQDKLPLNFRVDILCSEEAHLEVLFWFPCLHQFCLPPTCGFFLPVLACQAVAQPHHMEPHLLGQPCRWCPSGARVPPVPGLCCPGSSVAAQGRELGIKGLPTLPLTVLAVGMVLSRWAFCPGGQQANVTTWCPQGAPQPRSCVTTAFRCSTESSQDLAVTRNHAP